jgi:hypothetical protein
LVVKTKVVLKPGAWVVVPWGLDEPRRARIIDVWGDPPTQIRVELEPLADDEDPAVLLLSPNIVIVTPAA